MRATKHFLYVVFHLGVAAFGIALILGPIIFAQPARNSYETGTERAITDIERRLAAIEAKNLDTRLAVLESLNERQLGWLQMNTTGTGALLLGAAAVMLKRRKITVELGERQ